MLLTFLKLTKMDLANLTYFGSVGSFHQSRLPIEKN
ncbi:hypothetical protein Avbf_17741 [Armadillidium vulgare]|nr:hypothetical protein Avbf_17741 [Armadillidium vulgare]